jgi:hypothetical protein
VGRLKLLAPTFVVALCAQTALAQSTLTPRPVAFVAGSQVRFEASTGVDDVPESAFEDETTVYLRGPSEVVLRVRNNLANMDLLLEPPRAVSSYDARLWAAAPSLKSGLLKLEPKSSVSASVNIGTAD